MRLNMKFLTRFFYLSAGLLLLASCAKDQSESYDKIENQALEAWMAKYRPKLVKNKQADGAYYVEVLNAGDMNAAPISDTACWVRFDFSGRDLSGNIVLTRRAQEAKLIGTYTKYTHYVPYFRYCGTENTSLLEGTYLAMHNTIKLDPTYAAENSLPTDFKLREGSKIRLYMPSRVVGSSGVEGQGGYEGQYSLSSKRPFIVEMEICDTVKNPLANEGNEVDAFCKYGSNGGLKIFSKSSKSSTATSTPMPTKLDDPLHPYNIAERWVSACDTVAQLYVNYRFTPTEHFTFPKPYNVGYEPYNKLSVLEDSITAVLVRRFHSDEDYVGVKNLTDSVKTSGTAKIWYIGRFLDGFIFDTNIDEVKKLIYGEVKSTGSALSYTPSEGGLISAFYYAVPNMRFGQWAAFITTSTNAYGSTGQTGGTSTSTSGGYSSSYYDYLNYMNYANSYYGSSGYYGGYYNNYYGGYGGYYGGYYGNYDTSSSSTTTTTTISTEIPPYMPLIFEFYIEPND